ncbi:tetratricopeptide repeat protein [Candidatus Magnetaquicoccus inordinatus]|uniref:tetratricopeptide repeat protein n=1 Tax=Candidatus Magnetaquicoccus inordinatus TaxID=2496818 RepID=UPI00102B8026|nr:tetratricopeptide repeat protein [Candidatus Magnetaquicoccus inordinatus]
MARKKSERLANKGSNRTEQATVPARSDPLLLPGSNRTEQATVPARSDPLLLPGSNRTEQATVHSSPDSLLLQLRQWYAEGKLQECLQAAEAALQQGLEDAALFNLAAVCHVRLGQSEKAQEYWQKALGLRPDYAEVHNNLGNLHLQQNRWSAAEECYRQALLVRPAYGDALNNLGNLLRKQNKEEEAEALYRQALQLDQQLIPVEIYCNFGSLLLEQKRFSQAESCYQQALQRFPQAPNARFGLASVWHQRGNWQEAEAEYRQLLQQQADHQGALFALAKLLQQQKDYVQAEALYQQLLIIHPAMAEAHNQWATLLKEMSRYAEAEEHYRSALRLQGNDATYHNNLATLLQTLKRYAEAESAYRQALLLSGGRVEIYNNLAVLLQEMGRGEEAEQYYRQALQQDAQYAVAYCNLGSLLFEQKRAVEAEASYRDALRLQPDYAEALNNLGNLLKELRRYKEAEECYRRALLLQPDYRQAEWNLALLLLLLGRFHEGWPCYEVRWQINSAEWRQVEDLPFVRWQGESLVGKSIIVAPEQGYGDQIQFCRYVPLLKERGATWVTVLCSLLLKPLFATLPGVDQVLAYEQVSLYPRHDYWVSLLSLPICFATTLQNMVNQLPYLQATAERISWWRPLLPRRGLRVGLFWRGRATPRDVNRSLPDMTLLAPLWSVKGVSFISLQKGEGEEEASHAPAQQPLLPLGAMIRDFADTAAIVAQLDLLITVDSAVAHVAGALGKPCWLLLSAWDSDWRWLLERDDSPWYPGVLRLFRQRQIDDWAALLAEVATELAVVVSKRQEKGESNHG